MGENEIDRETEQRFEEILKEIFREAGIPDLPDTLEESCD